jgi:hypothetical protein
MKKLLLAVAVCGLGSVSAWAQTDSKGITTSTDPGKAAAVEQHADQLRSQQEAAMSHKMSTSSSKSSHKKSSHKAHSPSAKASAPH